MASKGYVFEDAQTSWKWNRSRMIVCVLIALYRKDNRILPRSFVHLKYTHFTNHEHDFHPNHHGYRQIGAS